MTSPSPASAATGRTAAATVCVRGLTKRYGDHEVVGDLSFDVHPGRVTGFLGPNGSGKTTTLRMLLGLTPPSSGSATVLGRRYRDLDAPLRRVGVLLDSEGFHPGRTARDHLRLFTLAAGVPDTRADDLLERVGLSSAARRAVGTFSTGMARRLGLATALVGDPQVLLLDEPANGLDPAGILWLRELMRGLADEGRTVFVSSHVLAEMEQAVDHLVIIRAGRLVADAPLAEVLRRRRRLRVVTPETYRLQSVLEQVGAEVCMVNGALAVSGLGAAAVGDLAFDAGIRLYGLSEEVSTLEEAFLSLTEEAT